MFHNRIFKVVGIFVALILAFSAVGVTPAYAVTLVVTNTNDSGAGSLRDTIAIAPIGATITFDPALSGGTIHLASTLVLSQYVTIDGSALALPITISGDTDNNGTGDVTVFNIYGSVTVYLKSLIITKGMSNIPYNCAWGGCYYVGGGVCNSGRLFVMNSTLLNNSASDYGGGIFNNGTLTVTNSIFSDNTASRGGGIYNIGTNTSNATLTVTNSTFSNNTVTNFGGGIFNDGTGTLTASNSTLSDNTAGNSGYGGGISNAGTLTVKNSILSGNTASLGGGIYITDSFGSSRSITNSTLSSNVAGSQGGGIYNSSSVPLLITNSAFSSNDSGGYGGGIYNYFGSINISNSTFANNSASGYDGGGIYNNFDVMLKNSTLAGNFAVGNGGGILNNGSLDYANTIIANSSLGGDCVTTATGTIAINYNNLVEDGSCSSSFSGAVKLGALADNGGPTQTFGLLAGSPAIDAGDDTICAADPVNNLDQRGIMRPVGTHCDIGAFEGTLALPTYTLSITSANGIVSKSPDQVTYHEGDVVQLTATPNTGWGFSNWTGDLTSNMNPDSVTIHGNTSVTANYTQNEYILAVTSTNGIVSKSPDQVTYHEGDVVQITATPNVGWKFVGWTGGLTGVANPGSITIQGNTSITANYRKISTLTISPDSANDGWVLESGESTNTGGSLDSTSTTFRLGDDETKKQYRSILSFATGASLPDTAVITSVTLKIKQQSVSGGATPSMFQGFLIDIRNGFFNTLPALQAADFQATANTPVAGLGPFNLAASGGWYTFNLTTYKTYINKLVTGSGLTQFRLRFKLDDNNNAVANYVSFYSGNNATYKPVLIIQYYVP